jgi:hypothetical protein
VNGLFILGPPNLPDMAVSAVPALALRTVPSAAAELFLPLPPAALLFDADGGAFCTPGGSVGILAACA